MSASRLGDYPALYRAADAASLRGQQRYTNALRWRLCGLLVAALGGAVGFSLGELHVGGIISFVAFATALGAEVYTVTVRPDRSWYEGRAAAESVKTLTWRYAVKGEPFGAGLDSREADKRFLAALGEVLHDLPDMPLTAEPAGGHEQITDEMRRVRALPYRQRLTLYADGRIADQEVWYRSKSAGNEQRGHVWTLATIVLEVLGIFAAALRAFGALELDALGVLAAAAATVTAWMQARQHQTLATAYAVAAQELAAVKSEVRHIAESEWAQFVQDSEEAISREHTLWRASRGVRPGWNAWRSAGS